MFNGTSPLLGITSLFVEVRSRGGFTDQTLVRLKKLRSVSSEPNAGIGVYGAGKQAHLVASRPATEPALRDLTLPPLACSPPAAAGGSSLPLNQTQECAARIVS